MSSEGPLNAATNPEKSETQHSPHPSQTFQDNPLISDFAKLWSMSPPRFPCSLLDCPRQKAYEAILRETIEVLEATRKGLKPHQLQMLRRKIAEVLEEYQ